MRRLLVLLSVVLICCLPVMMVNAQSASSTTLTGQVVDPQGAVIIGATVTATDVATGAAHSAKTTSSGNYTIPNLPPATYDVKVEAPKFAIGEAKGITLRVGEQRDLGFKLQVAGSTESVEVTTEAPLLESTKTDVSTSVNSLEMERLPTLAGGSGSVNDYAQLALTAPGVRLDTSGISSPNGQANTGDLIGPGSMNNRGNLYNVDGANITDQLVSGRDGTGAAVDEVQELQVLSNTYNAEYGQATGVILNVATKSGSNGLHGDGHMYFRGRNLAASDPFYNLGLLSPTTGLVANPACPNFGISSDISGCPRAPFHRTEGGFTFGGPFVKDKLFWFVSYEQSRQSVPLILTPFGTQQTVQQPVNNLLYSGKIDYHVTPNSMFTARYAVDRLREGNVIVQTGTNITPDGLTSSHINNAYLNVGYVSSIRPTLTNEARFVFTRFVTETADNTNQPGVIFPDGTTTGADFCCPQGGEQKRYQYIDNVTWAHGKHTFKTGFNISYYPWNSLFPQFHFGQYVVTGTPTAPVPQTFTAGFGPGQVTSKDNIYGFYFQDTWKVTRKLTVNAGLRYDYEAGAFKGGKIGGPNGTCFQGNGLIPACSSDGNNWQPRIGFTYALGEKTLLRGAFAETTMLAFNNVVLDSLNFDGTTLNTVTIDGSTPAGVAVLGAFPNFPSPALLAPFAPVLSAGHFGRVRPIADNLHNPEMRSVTFGVEHQLSRTLKLGAQYIGQFGFGLFGERDRNAPPVLADPAHPGFSFFGPRPDAHFTAIRTNENSRTSHYNGLVVSANKILSNHVQFNASYTYSKSLTSGEDFFGLSEPADYVNIRPELGPAFNDIRHAANMGVVLDSGKVTSKGWAGVFANNLGLSWVGQIQSGRPYPVSTGSAGFANGRFFGAGSETQQRPNQLPDGSLSVAGLASSFGQNLLIGPAGVAQCNASGLFTPAQCGALQNTFAAPAGASPLGAVDTLNPNSLVDFQQVSGNVGRDAGRGSNFVKFDASLHKTFAIPKAERVKVELRFDAFNVFNTSNFLSYNTNDVLTALGLSVVPDPTDPTATRMVPTANFFNCTGCMRPNGTFAGTNGQTLHLSDVTHGKVSANLLQPTFNKFGDPGSADRPRTLQLSFHVRF
jgi:hypothetical protein